MTEALAVVTGSSGVVDIRRGTVSTHPAAVYLGRLAQSSRRTMRTALATIAEMLSDGRFDETTLDWASLRYQHTQAIRAKLADRYSAATANRHLAALRGVLKEAWRLGLLHAEDYHRAVDLQVIKGERLLRGRALAHDEISALFKACSGDSARDLRDTALLSILYGCGLRRAEAVALDLMDYDACTGALTVRHGKGNKARVVWVPHWARDALRAWRTARGERAGPLLYPVEKSGRIVGRRLSGQAVLKALSRRAEQANVAKFSPHDFRRTMISTLLDAGADVATVQKLAGHANVSTTVGYDRRGEAAKQRVADMVRVPRLDP